MAITATTPAPAARGLLRAALAGAVLSLPATFAAGVVYLRVIDRQSELASAVGVSAAVVLDPPSMLIYVPIGAIVGIALAAGRRWLNSTLAVPLSVGLAALAGALVGWLFVRDTPAIPLGLAVELVAASWSVFAAISIAAVAAKKAKK